METMTEFVQKILALLRKRGTEVGPLLSEKHGDFLPSPVSFHLLGRSALLTGSEEGVPCLLVVSERRRDVPDGFDGERTLLPDGGVLLRCGYSEVNASALRRYFPWCAPTGLPACGISAEVRLDGEAPERISLLSRYGVFPLLSGEGAVAVQAVFEIFSCDCRSGYALDGGRAGTLSFCEEALDAGATFFTLSPPLGTADSSVASDYAGKHFITEDGHAVFFHSETAEECASRFGGVVEFAAKVHALFSGKRGFAPGIALDDGAEPTRPTEHLFVMRELRKRNLGISILFPRWPKDSTAFSAAFRQHAAIASTFGGYRLAVPFGRDFPERRSAVCEMLHLTQMRESIGQIRAHFQAMGLKEP